MKIPFISNYLAVKRQKADEIFAAQELKHQECYKRANFSRVFSFEPEQLADPIYQQEAYIKLCLLAIKLKRYADAMNANPRSLTISGYNELLDLYSRGVKGLENFEPRMVENLPHWSLLPVYYDDLVNGRAEKAFKPFEFPELDKSKPYELGDWRDEHMPFAWPS